MYYKLSDVENLTVTNTYDFFFVQYVVLTNAIRLKSSITNSYDTHFFTSMSLAECDKQNV